ncbi:MAG: ORF6N domain-containing protein [Ignavibacteriales bacterium]|nr:ORF6N domain-containing protein [Ignavibacteriales bacterium]
MVASGDHLKRLKFSSSLPYAFTEHGAIMLASVLNSSKAIETSIFVVRAFIRLRQILSTHTELAQKLKDLELKINSPEEHIRTIFEALNQLLTPPDPPKRKIGFVIGNEND